MKHRYNTSILCLLLALLLVLGSGCAQSTQSTQSSTETATQAEEETAEAVENLPVTTEAVSSSSFDYLDTYITLTIYHDISDEIMDHCWQIIADYEERISRTLEGSEIYQLNAQGSKTMEDDILEMIQIGLYYSELTQGVFDITVQPITSLWNFKEDPQVPDAAVLAEAVTHVNYENLSLDGNTVTLTDPESGVDLGGIAKGYIGDQLKAYLISEGVTSALLNLGGDVVCIGCKPDGSAFKIGIQYPFGSSSDMIAIVELEDLAVVTSGNYERYFEEEGILYHHILNTETGYPCDTDLLSVTIISDASVDGDCLSTTCFALGLEEGLALADSLEGVYAAFVTSDYTIYYSEGFSDFLYSK